MEKYFEEKLVVIGDDTGQKLEFFMRPIKIKEFKLINRISKLAKSNSSDEFIDPLLYELVRSSLSIDTDNIPGRAVEQLVDKYLTYNFPDIKKDSTEVDDKRAKIRRAKKKSKRLAFYIDFLVNQGHSVPDIMELTIVQFNDLIEAAAERLNPEKEIMDPMKAFQKMGIPIRDRK